MRKGLQIEGARADGVLLVNLGDRQTILVNVGDHVKTTVVNAATVAQFGPWRLFTDVKPGDKVRSLVQTVVDQPGNLVPPSAVGALDFDYREMAAGPERQEFVEMLEAANLSVTEVLPAEQNFIEEPEFVMRCLSEIVPALKESGQELRSPRTFCEMLHAERTGVPVRMDYADNPFAKDEDEPPVEGEKPEVDAATTFTGEDGTGDGPPNQALGAIPGEAPVAELEGDAPGEGDEPEGDEAIASLVEQVDAALDAADDLVNELMETLGIEPSDEFMAADKTKALSAKLGAIRAMSLPQSTTPTAPMPMVPTPMPIPVVTAAMPPAPNDAGLPATVPPPPVSVAPHGIPGGQLGVAAADDFPGKPEDPSKADKDGKPEMAPLQAAAEEVKNPDAPPKGAIGKPNKKSMSAISACGAGQPPKA